jgi:hypothetical protein
MYGTEHIFFRKPGIIQYRYVEISYIGLYPNRKKSVEGTGENCINLLLGCVCDCDDFHTTGASSITFLVELQTEFHGKLDRRFSG